MTNQPPPGPPPDEPSSGPPPDQPPPDLPPPDQPPPPPDQPPPPPEQQRPGQPELPMGMPPPPPGGVSDAPYAQQPATGGGVKALLIALLVFGVIALIALIVVGAFLVLDDDDGDPETTTTVVSPSDTDGQGQDPTDAGSAPALSEPAETVEQGLQLAQADDCGAAEALMTSELAADQPCESPEWQMLASGGVEYDVLSSEVDDDGDEASVVVAFTDDSGTSDYEFDLERVDGAWLIDSVEPERG